MSSKPAKTAADYMAMAVCPALIMVLVGSLVFFLLQVGYSGSSQGRLRWTLFWFVFAMVLVSRIAIEKSQGAAFLYGLALAAATSLMLTRYIGFLWGVWLLLALIWWASNKIVWDCTLIDEDQDASGEGLLRLSQFGRWPGNPQARVRAVESAPGSSDKSDRSAKSAKSDRSDKRAPAHAPGLWVLYFSFAAVPVFGLGELFLASSDTAGRRVCFLLLFAYLSSALGLLLLTSFLGLRRYLRQRYLVMPARIASSWVTTGAGLALVVLFLAVLLPRPATPYSLAAFVTKLSSPDATGSTETRSPDETAGRADSADGQPQRGDPSGRQSGTPKAQAPAQSQSPPAVPPPPAAALQGAKWLPYLIAAVVFVVLLVRFWPEISAGLQSLMALSRKRRLTKRQPASKPIRAGLPATALLPDPFRSGEAARMSRAQLVLYTFEALRRWASSRGFNIAENETALEFAERLARREPAMTNEILLASSYFSHVAYAGQEPGEDAVEVLKRLWSVLGFGK